MRGTLDPSVIRDLATGPGTDTRQWISYGIVATQQDDGEGSVDEPVEFHPDYGPVVNVRLQPSGVDVRCRVAGSVAGNGEAEYHPFIGGDEVLVALTAGDERSCVIIGRLNNRYDAWPIGSVAGQDPTTNSFAFTRRRTAYVEEVASTWMVRVASHGAFVLIDGGSGNITLRDGSKGALQMGPDMFGYQEGTDSLDDNATPSPTAVFQLALVDRVAVLQMDDARLELNSSKSNGTPGAVLVAAPTMLTAVLGTNQPAEHVATVEFVLACLETVCTLMVPGLGPAALAALNVLIAAGGVPLGPFCTVALPAGLQIASVAAKPPANPVTGIQAAPTLGAVLFKTG